ncbi:MAG TPA: xanthine dehydrogenase family protein subunit M [Candidatus Acidoferrales bacterium]|nr:xanthine dehydrogenase family protein subunit M [Candidatus Acidoferrales bacterium]
MEAFQFSQAKTVNSALEASRAQTETKFVAGGTTLIDLMKLNVETPKRVVDINFLPLTQIESTSDGGLKIGAMVRNSDLAHDETVQQRYTVLSEALLSGASPQLRNMATTGGNLLQRTRCYYFRDTAYPCNKREPGSGCPAIDGFNRIHAILGTSEHCIATHPSDMAVAMMALEAVVHIQGANGERTVPLNDFYLLPGSTPNRENVLLPGDLITYVTLPSLPNGTRSHYLKLRDRASYEFALSSAAVVVSLSGNRIQRVRIALGGVGTKPWRSMEAEHALEGREANDSNFRAATEAALKGAKPRHDNAFKVELAKRCLARTLENITQSA